MISIQFRHHTSNSASQVQLPTITNIVSLSLSSGTFPDQFKHSVIEHLLKKSNLDRESLSSYRPISNLPCISELNVRLVKAQLTEHLHNILFNLQQVAYISSPATSDRHSSIEVRKTVENAASDGFGSNLSGGAAFCLPHQLAGILFCHIKRNLCRRIARVESKM